MARSANLMQNEESQTRDIIVWLGTVAPDARVLRSAAASPAANQWQRGLIEALAQAGAGLSLVGHWPEPLFPRGPLFVGEEAEPVHGLGPRTAIRWIHYLNVPLLRSESLRHRYVSAVRGVVSQYPGRVLAVISYNAFDVGCAVKRQVLRGKEIPWIAIVADADGSPQGYDRLCRDTLEADGVIVLSHGMAKSWSRCPVLHLDGGMDPDRIHGNEETSHHQDSGSFPFLYCGATNRWAGVDLLAEAFAGWVEPRARLWLCGKGAVPERFPLLKNDARVTCFGAVSDDRVDELASRCHALVNPRRTDLLDNQVNFPSKVLEYLRHGKPVISTWTDGLAPEYRDVLVVTRDGSAEALQEGMAGTMTWADEDKRRYGFVARQFLLNRRTWGMQANRTLSFIHSLPRRQTDK